jgi:hypothetical protein
MGHPLVVDRFHETHRIERMELKHTDLILRSALLSLSKDARVSKDGPK